MLRLLYGDSLLWSAGRGSACDIECKMAVNETGELSFTLPPSAPLCGKLERYQKHTEVVFERDGEELIRGRVVMDVPQLDGSVEYTVEGQRGYLNDSVLPVYSTDGSEGVTAPANPASLFDWYVAQHREQTGEAWEVGINEGDMLDPNAHILRSSTQRPNTWTEIKDKLLDKLGGYTRARFVKGVRYIDWLAGHRGISTQTVEVGKNVVDAQLETDMRDYYTAFIPIGKDGLGIGSLPDGDLSDGLAKRGDMVYNIAAAEKHGIIQTTVKTDSETVQGCLDAATNAAKGMEIPQAFEVTAVDLSRIDGELQPIREGEMVRCRFPHLGIDALYMCMERTIRIGEPDKYKLGGKGVAITDSIIWRPSSVNAEEALAAARAAQESADSARVIAVTAQGSADAAQTTADSAQETADSAVFSTSTDTTEAYSKQVPTTARKWASVDRMLGNTIVWNQLFDVAYADTPNADATVTVNSDGKLVVNGTSASNIEIAMRKSGRPTVPMIQNRMYYYAIRPSDAAVTFNVGVNGYSFTWGQAKEAVKKYANSTYLTGAGLQFRLPPASYSNLTFDIVFVDLTQMFGAGNEPTTTDDPRIQLIREYAIANPEYNAGELISAAVDNVVSRSGNAAIDTLTIPQNVRDLCPNYGASAGNVWNELDLVNKRYIQRVGAVDLGELTTWTYVTDGAYPYFRATINSSQQLTNVTSNMVCSGYELTGSRNLAADGYDKTISHGYSSAGGNKYVYVRDSSYTTAADFKSAMSGEWLYYELATPVTVDLSSVLFDRFVQCEAGGSLTFEQVDDTNVRLLSDVTYYLGDSGTAYAEGANAKAEGLAAQSAAVNARVIAVNAQSAAATADSKATNAATAASAADTKATNAATAASTAQTTANNAATAAATADAKAVSAAKTATDFITDTGSEVVLTDPDESGFQLVLDYDNGAVLIKDAQGNTVASYSADVVLGSLTGKHVKISSSGITIADGLTEFIKTLNGTLLFLNGVGGISAEYGEQAEDGVLNFFGGGFNFDPSVNGGLTCNGETVLHAGNTSDRVVYSGETDAGGYHWFWQKWAGGKAECWGYSNSRQSVAVTGAWGSLYESAALNATFPSGLFVAQPDHCLPSWESYEYGISSIETGNGLSASRTQSVYLIRPTTATCTGWLRWHAIGRWK